MSGIKNYSTNISVEKTVSEIEQILARYGATDILKQYDGIGNITSLSFIIKTEFGKMPFRLPMNTLAVHQVLKNQKRERKINIPYTKAGDVNHARKVGWRIIKDWIDAQLALLEFEMVKIEQVFLPYAYNVVKDQTLYEALREKKFAGILPESTLEQKKEA